MVRVVLFRTYKIVIIFRLRYFSLVPAYYSFSIGIIQDQLRQTSYKHNYPRSSLSPSRLHTLVRNICKWKAAALAQHHQTRVPLRLGTAG